MDPEIYKIFRERYEDNWYFSARAEVLTTFIRHSSLDGALGWVGDFGAGTGRILANLRASALRIGLEENQDLAAFGCQHYQLPFVQTNLSEGIPIQKNTCQTVLLLDVLEHITHEDRVLKDVFRTLKPGGQLIASVPALHCLWSRHDELHHHKRRYSKREFTAVLSQAGFQCEQITYYNSLLLPVVYLSRKLEQICGAWAGSGSDYDRAPGWLGHLLRWVFVQEKHLLGRWRLPIGVSLLALARKPSFLE